MKTKTLMMIAAVTALTIPFAASAGGDKEGNGGDACILGLKSVTYLLRDTLPKLETLSYSDVRVETLSNLMNEAQFATEEKTVLRGTEVDAINYPEQKRIVVNRGRCPGILSNLENSMAFLLHEYLGLMGIDYDYKITRKLLAEIKTAMIKQVEPNWNYACVIERLGDREIFKVIDTHNTSVVVNSGYLYGRQKPDLKEYSVTIQRITTSPFTDAKPKLIYQVTQDPGHDSSKREIIVPWTELKFEAEPYIIRQTNEKKTVQLLNADNSTLLEMDCYRTL